MKPLYFLFALAVLALPAPAQEVEIMKKMVTGGTQPLTDMPNIGRELAGLLARAGIRTPEELRRVGAVEAAVRIKSIRPDDPPCRSMLAGLDGAIRGVRWRTIPKAARDALWKKYAARTSPGTRGGRAPVRGAVRRGEVRRKRS
jgi:DNA transformation protein